MTFSSTTEEMGNWTERPAWLKGSVSSMTMVDGPLLTTCPVYVWNPSLSLVMNVRTISPSTPTSSIGNRLHES